MNSYIHNYCGAWRDREGNFLFIQPINDRHVYVIYVKSGEDKPLSRSWLDDTPASKLIGNYDPAYEPSLDIELSQQGDGFYLNLSFDFEDEDYKTIAP